MITNIDIISTQSTVPDKHIQMGKPKSKLSKYIGNRNPNTVYVFVEFTPPQPVAQGAASKREHVN